MHQANATIVRKDERLLLEIYFNIGPADTTVGVWGWSCEPDRAEVYRDGTWVPIHLTDEEWASVAEQIEGHYEF
jgi:hypothetical protein